MLLWRGSVFIYMKQRFPNKKFWINDLYPVLTPVFLRLRKRSEMRRRPYSAALTIAALERKYLRLIEFFVIVFYTKINFLFSFLKIFLLQTIQKMQYQIPKRLPQYNICDATL